MFPHACRIRIFHSSVFDCHDFAIGRHSRASFLTYDLSSTTPWRDNGISLFTETILLRDDARFFRASKVRAIYFKMRHARKSLTLLYFRYESNYYLDTLAASRQMSLPMNIARPVIPLRTHVSPQRFPLQMQKMPSFTRPSRADSLIYTLL